MKRALLWVAAVAVGGVLGWLAASGHLEQAFAQTAKPSVPPAGTQLPKPDPAFAGKVAESFKDSTHPPTRCR